MVAAGPLRGALVLAGMALAGLAFMAHASDATLPIANTYWTGALADTGSLAGRWSVSTGTGFGSAAENGKLAMWSNWAHLSIYSNDTATVYSEFPGPTNVPGTVLVGLNTYPTSTTASATSASLTWSPVGQGVDLLSVRETLTVGGWDTDHNYMRFDAAVCNLASHSAHVRIRSAWDIQAEFDGGGSRKSWSGPGFSLGPYDNIMEVKDYPTEMGYGFTDANSALAYFLTLNDDPSISWLPAPPTVPDRFYYWSFYDLQTSWEPTGAPGVTAIDGVAAYFWGYHAPLQLAAAGSPSACIQVTVYFLPVPDSLPPDARFGYDNGQTGCQESRVQFTDASVATTFPIASWRWDFGDGATSTQPNPRHQYNAPGTYTVRLTVADADGRNDTASVAVTSVGDPNCCPSLRPLTSFSVWEGDLVRFRLQVDDFEGDTIAYSAQGVPVASSLDGGTFQWQTQRGDAGSYNWTLVASDGCASRRDITVQVLPIATAPPARDVDQDGVADRADNCPSTPNIDQADSDHDDVGDACEPAPGQGTAPSNATGASASGAPDLDLDGVEDAADNCPGVANRGQADLDGDGFGDACDLDADNNGIVDSAQECPPAVETSQAGVACGTAGPKNRSRPTAEPLRAEAWRAMDAHVAGAAFACMAFVVVAGLAATMIWRRRRNGNG